VNAPTTHDAAIAWIFARFTDAYPRKWKPGEGTAETWLVLLSDATPQEICLAAVEWMRSDAEWPPEPGQLRARVPRFCRCGKCHPCHKRAMARAVAAVERGALGADVGEEPARLGAGVRDALPQSDVRRLTQ
jgi:hypothetical protein